MNHFRDGQTLIGQKVYNRLNNNNLSQTADGITNPSYHISQSKTYGLKDNFVVLLFLDLLCQYNYVL